MKNFVSLIEDILPEINELFPWDLEERIKENSEIILVDIREPYEYEVMHLDGTINVPRGVLESACDWGYDETVPKLASSRKNEVILICRSGNRSALAAYTLQLMGYENVSSLKTGLAGWNDYELPLVNNEINRVPIETGDDFFESKVKPEQMEPESQ
ncbi:MAG: rhodanese-like domain-containing protein [Gammaproteobacteria bacterium]|nr:rhodanese-like domain-containing protein [Gammaproteobacteria bacterium]